MKPRTKSAPPKHEQSDLETKLNGYVSNLLSHKATLDANIEALSWFLNPSYSRENNRNLYYGSSQATSYQTYMLQLEDVHLLSVARKAISDYLQALLPLGHESVRVNYETQIIEEGLKIDAELLRIVTDECSKVLQTRLGSPSGTFLSTVSNMASDFILYGNCLYQYMPTTMKIDGYQSQYRYVSFTDSYLEFDFTGNNLTACLIRTETTYNNLSPELVEISHAGGAHDYVTHNLLFVASSQLGNTKSNSWESYEWAGYTMAGNYIHKTFTKQPIQAAKTTSTPVHGMCKNTTYGDGDGIMALGSAFNLNRYVRALRIASERTADPAVILAPNLSTDVLMPGACKPLQGAFSNCAGAINMVQQRSMVEGAQQRQKFYETIPVDPNIVNINMPLIESVKEDIAQLFYKDSFPETERSGITATEINFRASQSIKEFKAKSLPFVSGVLTPLVKLHSESINFNKNINTEAAIIAKSQNLNLNNYTIDYYSLAAERQKEIDRNNLTNEIQLAAQMNDGKVPQYLQDKWQIFNARTG